MEDTSNQQENNSDKAHWMVQGILTDNPTKISVRSLLELAAERCAEDAYYVPVMEPINDLGHFFY